jgi:uncharacterized membrane protein YsdA (DUF1294 family)/cold shock CspA family protein
VRVKGKLIKWNENKAFGFVMPNGEHTHVFIHKTALRNKSRVPKVNDIITFSMSKDKAGRHCACDATFTGETLSITKSNKTNMSSVYLSIVFFAILSYAYFVGEFPLTALYGYIGLSMFTFLCYAFDKFKAKRGGWRTQESTLHILSLVGGWPGAAFAQQFLRHKSAKKPFRVRYWLTVVINVAVLGWLSWSNSSLWLLFS